MFDTLTLNFNEDESQQAPAIFNNLTIDSLPTSQPPIACDEMVAQTPVRSRKNMKRNRRNRNKQANTESTLDNNLPKLFANLHFIITGISGESRASLEKKIVSYGGALTCFDDYNNLSEKDLIVLANKSQHTESYFLANLLEIPRLRADYIDACIEQNKRIEIEDNLQIEEFLLLRGVIHRNEIKQEIPYSLKMLPAEERVFSQVTFEVHICSNDDQSNKMLHKLIDLSGANIVTEITSPDASDVPTQMIVYTGDIESPSFQSVLTRANNLGILIVNTLYIVSSIVAGHPLEIVPEYSPNRAQFTEASNNAADEEEMKDDPETTTTGIQEHSLDFASGSSSSGFSEVKQMRVIEPKQSEWIYDQKQTGCITGFYRYTLISFTEYKVDRFVIGDTVRLRDKQLVMIHNFEDKSGVRLFSFMPFLQAAKGKRILSLSSEKLPISAIDDKITVYWNEEEAKREYICLEMIGANDKLISANPKRPTAWNDHNSHFQIIPANSLAKPEMLVDQQQQKLQTGLYLHERMESTTEYSKYKGCRWNGQNFYVDRFVQVKLKDGQGILHGSVKHFRQITQSQSTEINLKLYRVHPDRSLSRLSDETRTIDIEQEIESMSPLVITTLKNLKRREALETNPLCFAINQ